MLEFLVRPLRAALGGAEHEVMAPLDGTKRDVVDAVAAVHRASESIEHHVEVVEGLATAVEPLTDAVTHLTATVAELVKLLAPLGEAEREVGRVEHLFGLHRRRAPAEPESTEPGA